MPSTPKSSIPPRHEEVLTYPPFARAVAGEMLGTAMFLFFTLTMVGSGANLGDDGNARVWNVSFTFGFMIFLLVYSFAGISGSHINPAVTFACLVTKKVSGYRFLMYVTAQVFGAIIGAGIAAAVDPDRFETVGGGCNQVFPPYTKGGAFIAEVCGTGLLVWTVFAAIDQRSSAAQVPHLAANAPLAIGMAVAVAHQALIPIDNCSINPARTIASLIIESEKDECWEALWITILGPLVGAAIAGISYEGVFTESLEEQKPSEQY